MMGDCGGDGDGDGDGDAECSADVVVDDELISLTRSSLPAIPL